MIRLLMISLGLIALLIILSKRLKRKNKYQILAVMAVVCIVSLGYEQWAKGIKKGLISVEEVKQCGWRVKHSYRSNFHFDFCLQNQHNHATIKRIELDFIAQQCGAEHRQEQTGCDIVQRQTKSMPVNILPKEKVFFKDSLPFDQVNIHSKDMQWVLKVTAVSGAKTKLNQ